MQGLGESSTKSFSSSKSQANFCRECFEDHNHGRSKTMMKHCYLSLFLLMSFAFVACERQVALMPPVKPVKELDPKVETANYQVFQFIPYQKRPSNKLIVPNFGLQVKKSPSAKFNVVSDGYILEEKEFSIYIRFIPKEKYQEQNISQEHLDKGFLPMEVKKINEGFFSWILLHEELYQVFCLGNVSIEVCKHVIGSLQIIKR
jgi:hypothetical protein